MDTLFFKPLVFGGFAALALVAVLVLRRQLDVFHCFVRRLSVPERVTLVGFLAICIAYGGSKTNSPSMMMARPPARPTVTSDDIARGWQFVGTRTNGNVCYTMPVGATLATNWWVRGAYEDVVKTGLGSWSFPFGTNAYSSLWAFSWGKARFRFDDTNEITVVASPMSAVPYRSRLWTLETNNSFLVTWENFALNRDTNTTISAQLELHRSGDFVTRSNDVETICHRIHPSDWDGDGRMNEDDARPYCFDGSLPNPVNELPEGANELAYYTIDLAVEDAASLVTFEGNGDSDLPDARFVLKPGETNSVWLLIGKTYEIRSEMPLVLVSTSDSRVEVTRHDERNVKVEWPVEFRIVSGGDNIAISNATVQLPYSTSLGVGQTVSHSAEVYPLTPCDEVVVEAVFTDAETGEVTTNRDALAVVKVELKTVELAPCHTNWHRHVYGVRERVVLRHAPTDLVVSWQADNTNCMSSVDGEQVYRCPLTLDEPVNLNCRYGQSAYYPAIEVLEPQEIEARNPEHLDFNVPPGSVGGAMMQLDLYVLPLYVSFGQIYFAEIPCYTGTHTGFYDRPDQEYAWYHTSAQGAGFWGSTTLTGRWAVDTIGHRGIYENWCEGTKVWDIPIGWLPCQGNIYSEPVKQLDQNYTQTFAISSDGTLTVEKFANEVHRTIMDHIYVNGVRRK